MRKLILLFTAVFLLSAFSACSSDSDSSNDSTQAEVKYFAVTFETFGGTDIAPQSVESGKTATKPTDPTKDGYIFAGWYTDSGLTAIFSFGEAVAKNITLYAKWIDATVPNFTVTFDTNGGSSVESQVVKSGTCVSEPAAPTKETVCENGHESEYEFAGWYMDSGFSEPFDFGSAVTADIKLYAKWNMRLSVVVKDGQSFNTFLKNTLGASDMTAFKRTSEAPSTAAVYYLDKDETDSLIPIWYDASSKTVFYYIPDNVYKLKIESGYHMFNGCESLTELDVGGFDTSKVTNMESMFESCSSLTELDVSGFDTSKVTDMGSMFRGCESLTELDVSGFDTSNVTYMGGMFRGCESLRNLDVSGFDTSKVTGMGNMFGFCSSLTELDVSGFDTSNVSDMSGMFYGCESLRNLDVSGFDTSNVTDMFYMFYNCSSLTELDVSRFDTGNVTDMHGMFRGCESLTELDVSGFDTGNITNMSGIFDGCGSLVTIYASPSADWNMSTVSTSSEMFFNCKKLKGGNGTEYSSSNVDVTYAHVDTEGNPGYFTAKN